MKPLRHNNGFDRRAQLSARRWAAPAAIASMAKRLEAQHVSSESGLHHGSIIWRWPLYGSMAFAERLQGLWNEPSSCQRRGAPNRWDGSSSQTPRWRSVIGSQMHVHHLEQLNNAVKLLINQETFLETVERLREEIHHSQAPFA
jgi:hypothetical protein